MKNLKMLMVVGAFIICSQAQASLSLYAPYDNTNNFNLTVGAPSTPTTNGSPGITTGFLFGNPGGGALDAPNATNGLKYGTVGNYFAGVGNGQSIGSNTFRILFQPDFSGTNASRAAFFSGSDIAFGDTFAIFNNDNIKGPTMRVKVNGTTFDTIGLSNFNWSTSTWYYMGGSSDRNGLNFYMQAMTNNSAISFQSLSFGAFNIWGSANLSIQSVNVGFRSLGGNEGARGNIDDVKVFSNEKWGLSDFALDYAVIIPEPSSGLLIVAGAFLAFFRRRNG